jgi:hypothetical protein
VPSSKGTGVHGVDDVCLDPFRCKLGGSSECTVDHDRYGGDRYVFSSAFDVGFAYGMGERLLGIWPSMPSNLAWLNLPFAA